MRLRYLDHWTFSASCSICTDGCEGHGTGMKKKRKANGWQMGKQIQHIASLLADKIDGTMRPSIDVQIPSLQSFSFTLRKWAPKGLQYFYQQKRCNCGSKGKISKIERLSQGNTKSLRVSLGWRDWQEKTGFRPWLADWYYTAGDHHIVVTSFGTNVTFEPLSLHPWWCNNIPVWFLHNVTTEYTKFNSRTSHFPHERDWAENSVIERKRMKAAVFICTQDPCFPCPPALL